jgi:eukaryotic-like serine/threonine-protein kinase
MPIAAGRRVGRYEILSAIGAGGMGEVYRARDSRLGREVALKVLPPEHSSDPDRRLRFRREAQALAALSHPNILALHDADSSDGTAYASFELLEGETLREKLERGPVRARKVAEWGAQVCRGLAAAHARGIVHRDLKPENLAFAADGSIKILDFGLARWTEAGDGAAPETNGPRTATQAGALLGTAGYMSPEQVRGRPADARSDLWSVGAVLYEMLTGRRAFEGPTAADTISAVLHRDPPETTSGSEPVPSGLERIVRRCLEKEPDDRFQTARDLGFALERLSGSSVSSSSSPAAAVPAPRRPWILAGAVALLTIYLVDRPR